MTTRSNPSIVSRLQPRGLTCLVVVLGAAFVGAVLLPGARLTTALADDTAALKSVAEQRRHPGSVIASLAVVRERIETRVYLQEPLQALRESMTQLDDGIRTVSTARSSGVLDAPNGAAALADPAIAGRLARVRELWEEQKASLEPLTRFTGIPYRDTEAAGAELNDEGVRLLGEINAAIHLARRNLPLIDAEFASVDAELQAGSARAATELRLGLLAGLLIVGALLAIPLLLLGALRRQERILAEARQHSEKLANQLRESENRPQARAGPSRSASPPPNTRPA